MRRFKFQDWPLDMALRRLLLEIKLPTETQQIDRILGAFAERYEEANAGLFVSPGPPSDAFTIISLYSRLHLDNAYVLAYSLVLLHSDAFNQANKSKMQKADYVKNTRLPGVFQEVLEVRRVAVLDGGV